MAIARVTANSVTGSSTTTSVSAVYAQPTVSGNVLTAWVWSATATGTIGLTGWTNVKDANVGSTSSFDLFYKVADGTETTITATGTGSALMRIALDEYSGLATSSIVDASVARGNVGSAATHLSNDCVTTNAADLVLAGCGWGGGATSTPFSFTNSFTAIQGSTTSLRFMTGEKIVSSTGTYNTTFGWSTNRTSGSIVAAFKASTSEPHSGSSGQWGTAAVTGSGTKAASKAGMATAYASVLVLSNVSIDKSGSSRTAAVVAVEASVIANRIGSVSIGVYSSAIAASAISSGPSWPFSSVPADIYAVPARAVPGALTIIGGGVVPIAPAGQWRMSGNVYLSGRGTVARNGQSVIYAWDEVMPEGHIHVPVDEWHTLTVPLNWVIAMSRPHFKVADSLELVPIGVRARTNGADRDPTGATVSVAFTTSGTPDSGDFIPADWASSTEEQPAIYYARTLVGPGSDAELDPGRYRMWAKFEDSPEEAIVKCGLLVVG